MDYFTSVKEQTLIRIGKQCADQENPKDRIGSISNDGRRFYSNFHTRNSSEEFITNNKPVILFIKILAAAKHFFHLPS